MKKVNILFANLFLASAMVFTSCGDAQKEPEEDNADNTEETDNSETDDNSGWTEFKSEAGNFSVMMPGEPEEQVEKTPTAMGDINIHLFMHQIGEEELYMIGYNDMPAALMDLMDEDGIERMLQGGKQGATQVLSAYGDETVVDKEEMFKYMGKYPALKMKAHNGEHYVFAKYFIKENRLYQVMKMKAGDYSNAEKVDKFFSSFRLLAE